MLADGRISEALKIDSIKEQKLEHSRKVTTHVYLIV